MVVSMRKAWEDPPTEALHGLFPNGTGFQLEIMPGARIDGIK